MEPCWVFDVKDTELLWITQLNSVSQLLTGLITLSFLLLIANDSLFKMALTYSSWQYHLNRYIRIYRYK